MVLNSALQNVKDFNFSVIGLPSFVQHFAQRTSKFLLNNYDSELMAQKIQTSSAFVIVVGIMMSHFGDCC